MAASSDSASNADVGTSVTARSWTTRPAAGQDPWAWERYSRAMVLSVIALTDRVLPTCGPRHWRRIVTSTSSGVVAPISNLGISNTLRIAA